jgi:hypothetical protein
LGGVGGAIAGGLLAAGVVVDIVGRLGGYAWRDNLLSKINPATGNTSVKDTSGGGQLVAWYGDLVFRDYQDIGAAFDYDLEVQAPINSPPSVVVIGFVSESCPFKTEIKDSQGNKLADVGCSSKIISQNWTTANQPTIASPSGYIGTNGDRQEDRQNRKLSTPVSTLGSPEVSPNKLPSGSPSGSPIGSPLGTQSRSPASFSPAPTSEPLSSPIPLSSPKSLPSTKSAPPPLKERDEKKSPIPPITPQTPNSLPPEFQSKFDDLGQQIGLLGFTAATVAAQTTPEAQRLNSKNGACDALQSPSCTKGMEDRIKDPINSKLDAAQVARDANAATQTGLLGSIISSLATVGKFVGSLYNNQFVQSTVNYLTFATTIHNAAMLTRDIGDTLGGVVDNGLSLAGRQFQDSEGNQVPFSELVGNNAKALITNVIGAERYADLTLKWQKASVVLNSAANIINTTQSMLDPMSTAIEYGMENVSKIGNGLRDDGIVGEFAYGNMDETINARRRNRFEVITDNLEGAEDVVSNLSNVTSSAVSIKEDFRQLKEDKQNFQNSVIEASNVKQEEKNDIIAAQPVFNDLSIVPAPTEDEPEPTL